MNILKAPNHLSILKIKSCILVFGSPLLLIGCASTVTVKPISDVTKQDAGAGGVIYALPKTVIVTETVFTKVEKVAPKKAHFAKAAEILFGITPYSNSTNFSLGDCKISTRTEKDENRIFRAKIRQDPFSTQKNSFTFSKNGVLSKSESSAQNRSIEYAVTTIESAAKIAATGAKALELGGPEVKQPEGLQLKPEEWSEIARALARIKALADQKQTLLLNSGPNTSALVDNVDVAIAKEVSAFIGISKSTTASLFVEYTPLTDGRQADESIIPLFDYRDSDSGSGGDKIRLFTSSSSGTPKLRSPVPLGLKTTVLDAIPGTGDMHHIGIRIISSGVSKTVAAAASLGRGDKGFHYCIPADARLDIIDGKHLVTAGPNTQLPQYGIVACLPASTGSEKTGIKVSLDPDTGGLLDVGIEAEAFDPKYVQRVGDAVNTVIDAQVERHNREVKANDELTQLQRTKDILQLKSDISKLQTEAQAAKTQQ